MAITKPPVLPAWADAGDKVQPSNAELSVGWPVSSTPPSRQRFNWALNFVANAVRYFSRRGLVDYDVAETYMIGDRVIGDDGKTYKCLVDKTIAFTPSTNPVKWSRWGFTLAELNAEVTTPAQFDNTTKVATTAFVQRTLGNFSGMDEIAGAMTLTSAAIGRTQLLGGVSTYNVTLPLAATCPSGTRIEFFNVANLYINVIVQGADLVFAKSTSGTGLSLLPGDNLTLESNSVNWYAVGGSANLKNSGGFSAVTGPNGWQRLPSGLIVQWVSGSGVAVSGTQVVTFPTTFPTAHLKTFITNLYASAAQNGGYGFISATTSAATIARNNVDNGYGVTPLLFSIGY